ncbi:hypothetical protein JHK86_055366 [Glycine max]|nr:hypothetical protein JHK86_055366 [Glycine max]
MQIESRRRFRIIRSWDQDGYRVAEIEWIQDIMPPEGTSERETGLYLRFHANYSNSHCLADPSGLNNEIFDCPSSLYSFML